jgi:hypothetical protein
MMLVRFDLPIVQLAAGSNRFAMQHIRREPLLFLAVQFIDRDFP